ncbi:gluconokinase [Vibrio hangzhouensis]|uniref:Gluconokinase n=1 Tax=Vibrio hangzhouensis TaxID=462991 RepID=A0A1H5ZJU5_9VIBR|nr:gluconokinase [Vibrio hangzhouensis]MBY6195922.1 gluconokinase [Vibrio hangzhouensis]SEG36491.1 gluconokinase [Vibrio hangzhouensis]
MKRKYIVMGVSGCGKSSIGQAVADELNIPFFDGDDYHSEANVQKMQSGVPLTDEDRRSWLIRLNALLRENDSLVVACSALKPEYRDILGKGCQELVYLYLKGDFETIWSRHKARQGHYFQGSAMLESQFETLIEPSENEALHIDIKQTPTQITQDILSRI